MLYSFQLWRHPNIRYREAVQRLSRCELLCMLRSLGIETDLQEETVGSTSFLTFESRRLSGEELSWLCGHSCVVLMAEKAGNALIPLPAAFPSALPEELPEVLKYKGKTSPAFSRMMLNTALSLTPFAHGTSSPLTVLDPLCGRGTGLFCALLAGAQAIGIDQDGRDLKEASDYFQRFLKLHRVKHTLTRASETAGGRPVPCSVFRFSPDKEAFRRKETGSLTLYEGDTALAAPLLRKRPVHVITADLPYGVQHAPQSGRSPESFVSLLRRALPAWRASLLPGGALVLSFNTLTLKPDTLRELMADTGLRICGGSEFSDLAHPVEQAIHRDLIFATLPPHPEC